MSKSNSRRQLIAAGGLGVLFGGVLTLLIARVLPRAMAAAMSNMMSGMMREPDRDSEDPLVDCRRMMRTLMEAGKEMEE